MIEVNSFVNCINNRAIEVNHNLKPICNVIYPTCVHLHKLTYTYMPSIHSICLSSRGKELQYTELYITNTHGNY